METTAKQATMRAAGAWKAVMAAAAIAWLATIAIGCSRGGPELDVRTFAIEHADPGAIAEMIEPYVFVDREAAPGTMDYNIQTRTLTVRETPDNLSKIERVIAEFDRPEPQVTLRFQVIEADGDATTDPRIDDVVAELRQLFRFEGYALAGVTLVRGQEGSEFSQSVPGSASSDYVIGGRLWDVRRTDDGGSLALDVQLRGQRSSLLHTTVSIGTGQTVVIGTARQRPQGGAIILTVRAELEDG